ncbi:MAG: hypothetical protein RLZZ188_2694, partial [Verrucomicrobiota bacterium]
RAETLFSAHFEARGRLRLDPEGRSNKHTHWLEEEPGHSLGLAQVLVDHDDANDWEARFTIDLAASRGTGRVVLKLDSVGAIGA